MPVKKAKPQLSLNFVLQRADFVRASYWHMIHSPMALVFLLWICAGVYILVDMIRSGQALLHLSSLIFPVFIFILFPLVTWWSARQKYAMLRPGQRTFSFLFFADQVRVENQDGHSLLPWRACKKVRESKNYFFLFLSRRNFYILPKRAFVSPEGMEKLRALCRDNLGSPAKIGN
jgi:hypothetical protein